MARREWLLWVVSEDQTGMKHYRVSRDLVRLGIAAVLLVVGFLGSAATQLFHRAERSLEHHKLVRKTALLQSELAGIRTRIDTLRHSLDGFARNDETYRLVAGLEPIDADVQRVGIGGPGTPAISNSALFGVDPLLGRAVFGASAEVDELIRRARLLAFSWREAGDVLRRKYDEFESTPSILPTAGYISSSFSRSRWHPILGIARPHLGLDITAPFGTPVVASARGRVAFAGPRGDLGRIVEIDHGNGRVTRYAHLSRIATRLGQVVERNDVIGAVGQTGLAVAPHLHYEVLINGRRANPRRFILDTTAIQD